MDLQSDGYNDLYQKMNHQELSFFRVRTREKSDTTDISQIQHILHLPYEKKSFASNMRFSCLGMPCLYLGTTSYVCSRECEWNPEKEDLFAAAFIPNEQGDRLKILNLTISQALINGIYNQLFDENDLRKRLQLSMLKLFPLVIATSYRVLETGRTLKYEYLISQALMKVISTMNIDGIAYLSMKGKNEFQYPHGVNLALPAFDISESNAYSKYCKMFDVTPPVLFDSQITDGQDSFMAKVDIDGQHKFYGDTIYADFDNFLVSCNKNLPYDRAAAAIQKNNFKK